MERLRSWSFGRVVFIGIAWIIAVQLIVLWRPLMSAIAAQRTNPTEDFYFIAPRVPGGPLVLLAPPLLLAGLWWWARRRR